MYPDANVHLGNHGLFLARNTAAVRVLVWLKFDQCPMLTPFRVLPEHLVAGWKPDRSVKPIRHHQPVTYGQPRLLIDEMMSQ